MTPKLLFDASTFIQSFRQAKAGLRNIVSPPRSLVFFSTVVGAELLLGASRPKMIRQIDSIWHNAEKAKRLVCPNSTDWHETGQVIRLIALKYGYEAIGRIRLFNDVLIALSARRLGIAVVTHNLQDFQRISEFRSLTLIAASELGF